jgi:glycosyltransferase involved in cell wall biosynthesis
MRLSLILATIDRVKEVKCFLTSLDAQTYRDFELIIVDQNPDTRLDPLVEPYLNRFSILHLHTPHKPGASRARNLGLQHVKGDVVTFPDDDCWYPLGLLELVDGFLKGHPEVDGVSGHTGPEPARLGQETHRSSGRGHFLRSSRKVAQVPGPWSLFLRRRVALTVGNYDETLGPGAGTPWGAGEDTDYYLRVFQAGFNLYSNPDIVVCHSVATKYYADRIDLGRSYRYGAGRTRVWKRHHLPLWYFIYEVARSCGGVVLSLMQARVYKAYWHWGAFRGKLRGWFSS